MIGCSAEGGQQEDEGVTMQIPDAFEVGANAMFKAANPLLTQRKSEIHSLGAGTTSIAMSEPANPLPMQGKSDIRVERPSGSGLSLHSTIMHHRHPLRNFSPGEALETE